MNHIYLLLNLIFLLSSITQLRAQSSINKFLTPSDSLNESRLIALSAGWIGVYAGTITALNQAWYADYSRTSFHFFNDNGEWNQMDKAGHLYTAYFESRWSTMAFEWTGMEEKKAALIGSATGFVFQSTIEILDGFSEEWGASSGDLIANALGSALCVSQQLLWNEQRINIKFSAHSVSYDAALQEHATDIYGNTFAEKSLKDYNGQTYWISVNPSAFLMKSNHRFPKWLSLAAGYGAEGMLGGFDNTWQEDDAIIDRSNISRVRQFYFSPDIDFTRIKTNSAMLKTVFEIVNIIKIPAPAVEFNSMGKVRLHPIYF